MEVIKVNRVRSDYFYTCLTYNLEDVAEKRKSRWSSIAREFFPFSAWPYPDDFSYEFEIPSDDNYEMREAIVRYEYRILRQGQERKAISLPNILNYSPRKFLQRKSFCNFITPHDRWSFSYFAHSATYGLLETGAPEYSAGALGEIWVGFTTSFLFLCFRYKRVWII